MSSCFPWLASTIVAVGNLSRKWFSVKHGCFHGEKYKVWVANRAVLDDQQYDSYRYLCSEHRPGEST